MNPENMNFDEFEFELQLDSEERELLESIENDEWRSIPNVEQEIQRFKRYASEQISKQKIEIKISLSDVNRMDNLASQTGQSIASLAEDIIHKYLTGELAEK